MFGRLQSLTVFIGLLIAVISCTRITIGPESASAGISATIVESIPIGVDIKPEMTTLDSWLWLINNAAHTLDMAEFYFELTVGNLWPKHDGGWMGAEIDSALRSAHARGVVIRLVLNEPTASMNDTEAFALVHDHVLTVRNISWAPMFNGGILHTKLMIADNTHAYIGSANTGWTSLSQVKELGVLLRNAPEQVGDVAKIFAQYWSIALTNKVPNPWPAEWDTQFNIESPGKALINGAEGEWFIASTPDKMCAPHRTWELHAIQTAMAQASRTLCISVMDYLPVTMYSNPNVYFPQIDTAIRDAAFRGVQVRMLISKWNSSSPEMWQYLQSLNMLRNVQVNIYQVPPLPNQNQIPFTRVNHAKFMVTENLAYISTQNWTGDYFLNTGGIAIGISQRQFVAELQSIFDRDWHSQYSTPLPPPGQ